LADKKKCAAIQTVYKLMVLKGFGDHIKVEEEEEKVGAKDV